MFVEFVGNPEDTRLRDAGTSSEFGDTQRLVLVGQLQHTHRARYCTDLVPLTGTTGLPWFCSSLPCQHAQRNESAGERRRRKTAVMTNQIQSAADALLRAYRTRISRSNRSPPMFAQAPLSTAYEIALAQVESWVVPATPSKGHKGGPRLPCDAAPGRRRPTRLRPPHHEHVPPRTPAHPGGHLHPASHRTRSRIRAVRRSPGLA